MDRRSAALAGLVLVSLAGCGGSPAGPEGPSSAQSLWSARTSYIGDNSAVIALVREVGPAPQGSYSIALQTARPPYSMTIEMLRLDKPFDRTDFSGQATLLLGLVANLDTVSVTSDEHAYSLSAAVASRDLGYDVKELGRDRNTLTAYLDAAGD